MRKKRKKIKSGQKDLRDSISKRSTTHWLDVVDSRIRAKKAESMQKR